jgi:photosystem II stability/assembly factor-like uncharacterized protein
MKKRITLFAITCLFKTMVVAQWTQTNGPEGISVHVFFNVDDSTLLCGTQSKGIFRSSDHGNNWNYSNSGVELEWIDCFEKDSLYIYAGSFGHGVFRSSDNGYTWQPANSGIATEAVNCLVIGDGCLFAGTVLNGIYRSTDHGATWIDINQGLLNSSYILAMVYNHSRLTVEADNYIFFSTDSGGTWDIDQGTTAFYQIENFFHRGDTMLASVGIILFRSTDGGQNWGNPVTMQHGITGFDMMNDTIYAGSREGVYRSSDFGASWIFIPSGDLRFGTRENEGFAISGGNLLSGYGEIGIYISNDTGSSWHQVPLNQFPVASTSDDALIFHNGTVYAGTHSNGVYSTKDQGNSWEKIGTINNLDTLSNEIVFAMLHVGPRLVFAGGCGNGLFISDDNGNTWTHITAGLPPDNGNFTCIKSLAVAGPNILAAMLNGVYYSTDSGLTWNPTNLTTSNILQTGGFAVRDSIVCVGVIGNPSISTSGVYRSTDYGINYTITDNIPDIDHMATGGNHTMYCGELFTAYVSYDDGQTWNGLGIGAAFTILAWNNFAFIGNNTGILFSNNYGMSWSQENTGLDPYPNNAVQGLTTDSVYVYAAVYRDGVWRRPLSDFGITTKTSSVESEPLFMISTNPVNDVLRIITSSEINSKNAQVEIISSLGTKLYRSNLNENIITINVSGFARGFYIVLIKTLDATYKRTFIKN